MARKGQEPHFVRTLRVRNVNRVGVLAAVIGAIADGGASVGDLRIVASGPTHLTRDIDIEMQSLQQLDGILERLQRISDSTVLEVRDDVLSAHMGGKLAVVSKVPISTVSDLGRVYTPGVGEVCRRIYEDPEAAHRYTMISNTVAIISDGSAVLGLGNLGPVAAMPVLEGKAALLAQLVGVNGIPVLLDCHDVGSMVSTVAAISPSFGVIQLEDIASPRCFEMEAALQEKTSVAVFHDDQHGTASVVLAALINACAIVGKDLARVRIGQVGLGAAGLATARTVMAYTGNPVYGADIAPDALERLAVAGGIVSGLEEIMGMCEVVIATTGHPSLIPPSLVRQGQIVFALSNPRPEIEAEEAMAVGAAIAANGRAINNLLCYPGMCRGLLETAAIRATPALFLRASQALVQVTPPGQLLPNPLDRDVHAVVARAVARAAVQEGLARHQPDPEYFGEE